VSDTGTSPGGAPLEGTAFDLLLNTLTVDLLAHHTVGARVRGTLGASGLYQTNDTRGRIPLVPDARIRSGALFAFEQVALGRVSLLTGGRIDVRRLTADSNAALGLSDQTRDYTALSGTLGVVYRPTTAVALAANLGRAWRAPTLSSCFPTDHTWARHVTRSETPVSNQRRGPTWTSACAGGASASAPSSLAIVTLSGGSSTSRHGLLRARHAGGLPAGVPVPAGECRLVGGEARSK